MRENDVVQFVRHHIFPKKSTSHVNIDEIKDQNLYIEEEKYWNKFFSCAFWPDLPFFWKYTCTYCLCVPQELFKKSGGFRRAYTTYGFEDTDFGLRLHRLGAKFYLSRIACYHLTKQEKYTGHYHLKQQRQLILADTAKIFFRNNLEIDIFEHFQSYLPEPKVYFWRLRKELKNKLSFIFSFWK